MKHFIIRTLIVLFILFSVVGSATLSRFVFAQRRLTPQDNQVIVAAAAIWRRQEREAWQKLQSMKQDPACKCGESFEYIEARRRWSDIHMAESYFELMARERK